MNHCIENNEYKVDIDYTVDVNLKSFKEEVLDCVYDLYKTHGDITLLFSGGNDSSFLLRTCIELGITPQTISFIFTQNYNSEDIKRAKQFCSSYSLKELEFVNIDGNEIINHINYLTEEEGIVYPQIHGYVMDYFLKTNKGTKYISGMGSEFKQHGLELKFPPMPWMVKANNPDQLFDFTTSRTFLSYVNNKINVDNYKKQTKIYFTENGYPRSNQWYIRDLIYNDCYPDLNLPYKTESDFESSFDKVIKLCEKKYKASPIKDLKPYFFNVDEYFKQKKENNDN